MGAADITTTTTHPTATVAGTAAGGASANAGMQVAKSPTAPTFNPSGSFILSQQEIFPALSSTDESESSSSSSSSRRGERCATRTQLRAFLASSMSSMYRREVPLYGDLLSIISTVNSNVIRAEPDCITDDEISRLNVERHGAIRVGTPAELSLLARIFKLFGMHPVGYYDLARDAGLPIHATAFRPVGEENLLRNPFRIFCSLLRLDLIHDSQTRELAEELLSRRQIVSDRCVELLTKAEAAQCEEEGEGEVAGLSRAEALEFVERVVDIFAWHADTPVSLTQYQLLAQTHPLVADIVSFRGPHINHLTPRTLDIDAVQRSMLAQGIDAKDVIEGPPARQHPIYLRQTSFHALSEQVTFLGDNGGEQSGRHKARFGEIEARGQALTRKGARLYDALMHQVQLSRDAKKERGERVGKEECVKILEDVFREGFPDSKGALLREGLGFFAFSLKDRSLAQAMLAERKGEGCGLLARMVEQGALDAEPITYEDFLPASAAGIFQSNLPQTTKTAQPVPAEVAEVMDDTQARERLEAAVGGKIYDYFALYAEQQRNSLDQVASLLGTDLHDLAEALDREGA